MNFDPIHSALFLDRDGVINRLKINGYIENWSEFEFLEGSLEALKNLARKFSTIIITTNQQGIGKGLMTEQDLHRLHWKLLQAVGKAGGRIDEAFYGHGLARYNPWDRKPNIGMAMKAKAIFPQIDFRKSIIVGDSPSDMEFGHRLGMQTAFIHTRTNITTKEWARPNTKGHHSFGSLLEFSRNLQLFYEEPIAVR